MWYPDLIIPFQPKDLDVNKTESSFGILELMTWLKLYPSCFIELIGRCFYLAFLYAVDIGVSRMVISEAFNFIRLDALLMLMFYEKILRKLLFYGIMNLVCLNLLPDSRMTSDPV